MVAQREQALESGGGRIAVDTASITAYGTTLSTLGERNSLLATHLAPITAQVTAVLGLDPSGYGVAASSLLSQLTAEAGLRAGSCFALSQSVGAAASAYDQAEHIANQLLNQWSIALPEYLYEVSGTFAGDSVMTYPLKDVPFGNYFVSKLLFDAATYLDIKLNGSAFARQRTQQKLKEIGIKSFLGHMTDPLSNRYRRYGGNRDIAEDSILLRAIDPDHPNKATDSQRAELAEKLVVPETLLEKSQNLHYASQINDLLDQDKALDGSWIEYDGIVAQQIFDESGKLIAVEVYLPGTDSDVIDPYGGSFSSWPANLQAVEASPDDAIADSTPYLQFLDQVLDRMDLDEDVAINLNGFSQGGIVVAGALSNKEFRAKHKVKSGYIQGSPVGDLPLPNDVPVDIVVDQSDLIPKTQGNSHTSSRGDNVQIHTVDYYSTEAGRNKAKDMMDVHNTGYYAEAVAATTSGRAVRSDMSQLKQQADTGQPAKVIQAEGSTVSPGQNLFETKMEIDVAAGVFTYDALDKVLEKSADYFKNPVLKGIDAATIPIPEDFDAHEFYEEKATPWIDEHRELAVNLSAYGGSSPGTVWTLKQAYEMESEYQAMSDQGIDYYEQSVPVEGSYIERSR